MSEDFQTVQSAASGFVPDVRFIGPINGCYSLPDRQKTAGGSEVFACRSQSMTTRRIMLGAPVPGEIGGAVNIKLDEFEIIQGRIIRLAAGSFEADILANGDERAKIGAKLDWLKKHKHRSVQDKRSKKRFMLPNPRSQLNLEDGGKVDCFIIDLSATGAAVSADLAPEVGTRISLGGASATVVRKLPVGFAIQFDEPADIHDVNSAIAWAQGKTSAEDPADAGGAE